MAFYLTITLNYRTNICIAFAKRSDKVSFIAQIALCDKILVIFV